MSESHSEAAEGSSELGSASLRLIVLKNPAEGDLARHPREHGAATTLAPSPWLTLADMKKVFDQTDFVKLGSVAPPYAFDVLSNHVLLNPCRPCVDGKGELVALGARVFSPLAISYVVETPGKFWGGLEIWLRGLTRNASYLLQIRVGSYPLIWGGSGMFEIGSSEGVFFSQSAAAGNGQVIAVFLPGIDSDIELVTLTSNGLGGWLFYDASVQQL